MSNPLEFKASDGKPHLLLFGEIGNGKSTTGNFLIRHNMNIGREKKILPTEE